MIVYVQIDVFLLCDVEMVDVVMQREDYADCGGGGDEDDLCVLVFENTAWCNWTEVRKVHP